MGGCCARSARCSRSSSATPRRCAPRRAASTRCIEASRARATRRATPSCCCGYTQRSSTPRWCAIGSSSARSRRSARRSTTSRRSSSGVCSACPESLLPPDLGAFNAYLDATVERLEVSETARAIARELCRPAPPFGPLIVPWREITAGLLPPRLREAYKMQWDPARSALFEGVSAVSRAVWPRLPRVLRRPPALLLPPSARPRYELAVGRGAYAPGAR